MKQLTLDHPPYYPVDPWKISEEQFYPDNSLLSETVFALGNGYIGIRGSFEEGLVKKKCKSIEGIYLNGFYESVPIPHAEKGHGYALNSQTMLNVTNSKIVEIFIDQERFGMDEGTILKFRRSLDFKKGFLNREIIWRSPGGRELQVVIKRLVSFSRRHLMAFQYTITPLNFSGRVAICSSLDGDVDNHTHEEEDPRFSASLGGLGLSISEMKISGGSAVMLQETRRSKLSLACAMDNTFSEDVNHAVDGRKTSNLLSSIISFDAQQLQTCIFEKYVSYYTSRDRPAEELTNLAQAEVQRARKDGFNLLLEEQAGECNKFWDDAGLGIEGDQKAEQGLRFNLFHLFQAAGSNGRRGIAAKGLTSEGYDGHYFWDTEIYMLPFYTALLPREARKLLEYRYSILDHARSRARELSHPAGALYPWRTIAGEEGSSYYPASTAQYHINAAIAYAVCKYIEMTGDYDFMLSHGAEIIFETARLWEDLGAYISRKGNRFCFHEVTGPDEYTALVNNNCYTNLMASWHLDFAAETARRLSKEYPEEFSKIADKIGLQNEEPAAWQRAAASMFIPYDETLRIHPQDDSFLDKETWDFDSTPAEKFPLLLHYHPLVIYRYQVCKQPDIILAHLLLGDRFSLEQKRFDYNYYEPITTHDSSLSPSIFGVVASELGYHEESYRFFTITSRLDLDNLMKDTHFGVHMGNMAGSWLCLAYGFGGMRAKGDKLSFKPVLPDFLKKYRFRIFFRGAQLEIQVDQNKVGYKLLQGDSISFIHNDLNVNLSAGEQFEGEYLKHPATSSRREGLI